MKITAEEEEALQSEITIQTISAHTPDVVRLVADMVMVMKTLIIAD